MAWFRKSRADAVDAAKAPATSELNEAEQTWIANNLAQLAAQGIAVADIVALGALYDGQLSEWQSQPADTRDDPNEFINRVGIGFGEHIRARSGTRWLLATDEHGTELALHGQPGNILMFPVNMVAKRWVAGEVDALPALAAATIASIEEFRSRSNRPN